MPVSVPTEAEFADLSARVTKLEAAEPTPIPPEPEPIPPEPEPLPPGEGVQAKRIADLVERFGVNTFSSPDTGNIWGSWPADYRPETVISAVNWLTADSGLTLLGREYHYKGRDEMQGPWLKEVTAATGMRWALCIGANGSEEDVASMLALAADQANGVLWVEGINEPNTNFGSGEVPPATTGAAQTAVFAGAPQQTAGPSIVFGLPYPENWVRGYAGDYLDELVRHMTFSNGHIYPPTMADKDDGSGRGGIFDDIVVGMAEAYPGKRFLATEYHPTLYNMATPKIPAGGPIDGYYTLLALLDAQRCDVDGLWWYALFDYGSTYVCGLFPVNDTEPRASAWAIRALCAATGDRGGNKRSFAPGRFAYTVNGLPPPIDEASPHTGGHHDLYQSSDGRFYILLWNAQEQMGGGAAPVMVDFGRAPTSVSEFNLSLGTEASLEPLQSHVNVASVAVQLDASVRVLVVTP